MKVFERGSTLDVTVDCPFCKGVTSIREISTKGFYNWRAGDFVQNALPELSIEERELLINGVCRKCHPTGEEECES